MIENEKNYFRDKFIQIANIHFCECPCYQIVHSGEVTTRYYRSKPLFQILYEGHMHNLIEMNFYQLVCWFMMINATFNNISVISWRSVLLVEECFHRLYKTNQIQNSSSRQRRNLKKTYPLFGELFSSSTNKTTYSSS